MPLSYITDTVILNTEEMLALAIRGDWRVYRLKERFGFLTALEKESSLCGVTLDISKHADITSIIEEERIITAPPCFVYKVRRMHNPLPLLLSRDTPSLPTYTVKEETEVFIDEDGNSINEDGNSIKENFVEEETIREETNTSVNEDRHTVSPTRFLHLTESSIDEVVQTDHAYLHRSIPYQDVLVITAEVTDATTLVIQFQRKDFLRVVAFSVENRADFLSSFYCFYSSAAFHWTLVRTALRFRGTADHVEDIQHQCLREVTSEVANETVDLAAIERFLANSRYFSAFAEFSSDHYKSVMTLVIREITRRAERLKSEANPAVEHEALLLLLFTQEFTEHVLDGLSPSLLIPLFEPLFSALLHTSSSIQFALLHLLASITVQHTQPRSVLASSFFSSMPVLEFVVKAAFTSVSSFTRYNSLSVLIQAVLQAVSLPPPIPFIESLYPLLQPHLLSVLSLLEEQNAAIQTQLFFLLHSLLLHTSSEHSLQLQRHTIDTCMYLQMLRCALFDSSPSLQLIARALLALVSQHHAMFLSLLQRTFPREFIRVLETPHSPCLFRALAVEAEEAEKQTSSSLFVWKEIRKLAFPVEYFNFPAFFALYLQTTCSYKLVWGEEQRLELQSRLDEEIAAWHAIEVPARWNDSQFVVLYSTYQRHLMLFDYFFPQLAGIPADFYCSSLSELLSPAFVPSPRPSLDLLNPSLFFVSLYARLLTCDADASRVMLLQCMRVVYYDSPSLCGEFCDCEKVLEQIESLETGAVCAHYVELLQVLLLQETNTLFFIQHASTIVPVLLRQLALLHLHYDERHARILLDIVFHLLSQTTSASSVPLLPLSPVITLLSSPSAIQILASLLFLPSPVVTAFVARVLLLLVKASLQSEVSSSQGDAPGRSSVQSSLLATPFVDALLLQASSWIPVHVQLLKVALHNHDLLSGVFPAAVIFALEVVPETKFCSLFKQDTQSARLIWTESMRSHLDAVVHHHVDAYVSALHTQLTPRWDATPLPHIHYPELDAEIYCGKYYLRYLNDHSVMAVRNPVSLISSLKNEWIREGKRKGLAMTEAEARATLRVEAGATEDELHAAYWRAWTESTAEQRQALGLALDLLTGYRITATAPIAWRLFLIVRLQCQLYAAFYTRLTSFLYPSFEMLIAQMQNVIDGCESCEGEECECDGEGNESDGCEGQREGDERERKGKGKGNEREDNFAIYLTWLMYLTCSCSSENGELFVRKCGLTVVRNAMQWNNEGVCRGSKKSAVILYYQCMLLSLLSQSLSLHNRLCSSVEIFDALTYYLVLPLPSVIHSTIADLFIQLAPEPAFRSLLLRTRVSVLCTALPLLFRYSTSEEELIEKDLNEQCLRLSATLHNPSSRSSSISDASIASDLSLSTATDLAKEPALPETPGRELEEALCDDNVVARKVVRFLSLLVTNEAAFMSLLSPLLTKPLVSLLLESNTDDLLTILNSDFYETPFIVWTKDMRDQLLQFLQEELEASRCFKEELSHSSKEECVSESSKGETSSHVTKKETPSHFTEKETPSPLTKESTPTPLTKDSTPSRFAEHTQHFVFRAIENELIVADVYVRIFNEQQPKQFVKDTKYFMGLLAFLRSQRVGAREGDVWTSRYAAAIDAEYVRMMLQSLRILLANNPELEENLQAPEDLLVLFGFFQPVREAESVRWELDDACVREAYAVLALLTRVPRICDMCVDSQAVDILFLLVIQELEPLHEELVALLFAICANGVDRELVLFNTGLWLYALHLVFSEASETSSVRSLALSLLSQWCGQEPIKALCRVTLKRFLPEYIVEAVCEGENALRVVDSTTITAECIWDSSMRAHACSVIREEYDRFIRLYTSNQSYALPDDFEVVYEQTAHEWCVGHVFVALYLASPGYRVHRPTEFMDALVASLQSIAQGVVHPTQQTIPDSAEAEKKRNEKMVMLAMALCHECDCEDAQIAEYFAQAGYLKSVVGLWQECDATNRLGSVVDECCCLVVSKVAEGGACLKEVVASSAVLRLLLHCLVKGVHYSLSAAKLLNSLFKMKTPEMCEYLGTLNMIPCLLSCFDQKIVIEGNEKESAEILVGVGGECDG